MKIHTFDFSLASPIDAERGTNGEITSWTPKEGSSVEGRPFHQWGRGPFARLRLKNVPSGTGVYAVVKNDAEVMYIGISEDSLSKRWGEGIGGTVINQSDCFKGGRPTFCRLNHLIYSELYSGNRISLWVLLTKDPKSIKSQITEVHLPPWNINR